MKTPFGRAVWAFAIALAVGIVAVRSADRPDAPRRAAADPEARARATFRVSEAEIPVGIEARGETYRAEVTGDGLRFEAGGFSVALRATGIEQGGAFVTCVPGAAERPAFGRAEIDRGALVEEYVFENRRVEQLFHIPEPPGAGALRVRVAVDSDLGGPVTTVERGSSTWRETPLWKGGLLFHDAAGRRKLAYHSAVAIDAAGKRQELTPRYQGGEIVLEVPEAFMADAEFPLTVDPWLELDLSASGGGISDNTGVSQTPAVAIEGGGNPYVAWADDTTGDFEIYVRYFNGFEWFDLAGSSTGGGISNNDGDSYNPSIFLSTAGDIMVAWEDDTSGNIEIYCRMWTTAGQSWSSLAGSASGGGVSSNPGVSKNPAVVGIQSVVPSTAGGPGALVQNVPFIAWEDSTLPGSTEIMGAFFFQGDPGSVIPFFPPIPAGWYGLETFSSLNHDNISATGTGVSERPSATVDGTGRPVVAWQDTDNLNFEIYAKRYSPGGVINIATGTGAWAGINGSDTGGGISNTAGAGTFSVEASITSLPAGTDLFVAWTESDATGNTEILASQNLGAGWAGLGTVSNGTPGSSILPSIGVGAPFGGNPPRPMVAWQENESGNFEIFVKSYTGAGWAEVGMNDGSASFAVPPSTLGGVSDTFGGSWSPALQVAGFRSGVVVWQDWADGTFDIFVRRFYENEPTLLNQATTAVIQPDDIAVGQNVMQSTIFLRGTPFSEDTTRQVKIQVEVRPVGSPFVAAPTGESGLVPVNAVTGIGPEVAIPFTGLVNTGYHWRARTVDDIGNASAWISFGNNLDGVLDFGVVTAPPAPPSAPSGLVATGGPLQISLTWSAPTGSPTSYDVMRAAVSGGPYTQIANVGGTSYVDTGLPQGATFFYVVFARNGAGQSATSSNEASATTLIGVSPPTPKKDRCGMLGLEALALLGLLAAARRRRRRDP